MWKVGVVLVWAVGGLLAAHGEEPAGLASRAAAAMPDRVHGAELYARYCERCHRSHGSAVGERQFPQLAGQQQAYLLAQLAQFITLDRTAPAMHRVLTQDGLQDPQSLADLSAYLAAQPHDPYGEHGDAHRLGRGRAIYNGHCAECHGGDGEGRAVGVVPAVAGQNYSYLLAQLKGFAAGHRSRVDTALIASMGRLSADDMRAVADFMSRMPQSIDSRYGVVPEKH